MLMRFACTCFVGLVTSVALAADESATKTNETEAAESAAEVKSLAEQIEEIEKTQQQEYRNYLGAMQSYNRFLAESKQKLLALVKENPGDPAALDGVLLLVNKLRTPLDDELLQLVMDNQLSNPKVGELCWQLRWPPNRQTSSAETFLRQIAEKHEKDEVRGLAAVALGEYYRRSAQNAAGKDGNADDTDGKQARFLADAEKYLNDVTANFASISMPDGKGTLGEKAEKELLRVRNMPNLKVGKVAPEIEGLDIDGQPLKLSDSRGKVTVLIFWGSWCGPCMALVPHERELYERMQGKPFAMVSVNCGDTRDKAQETRKTKEMPWRCWWDAGTTDGSIQAAYNVPHYPRIIVLDSQGVIRYIDVRNEKLDEAVDKLLDEMDAGKMARR